MLPGARPGRPVGRELGAKGGLGGPGRGGRHPGQLVINSGGESSESLGSDMSEEHKRYLAELIGTAVLVLVGCAAAAIGTHATGATPVNVIAIAFASCPAVTPMASAICPVSAAHLNPP